MIIHILGSGQVARSLAMGLANTGHRISLATRNPENPDLTDFTTMPTSGFGSSADMVIIAVKGSMLPEALNSINHKKLTEKVIIDVTNPLDTSGDEIQLATLPQKSAGELVQSTFPSAFVVKAFNTVNNQTMIVPDRYDAEPDFFYCGNEGPAKEKVKELAQELGWKSFLDLGPIQRSRELEALTLLWVRIAGIHKDYGHAFKVLEPLESKQG